MRTRRFTDEPMRQARRILSVWDLREFEARYYCIRWKRKEFMYLPDLHVHQIIRSISGVLKGIGAGTEYLDATLRFSFSEFTTKEEIDYTLETLYNCVPMLRKYTRH